MKIIYKIISDENIKLMVKKKEIMCWLYEDMIENFHVLFNF